MSLSLNECRSQFASLGSGFAYFDSPGGTQTPDRVRTAIADALQSASGNTGAPYATSTRIGDLVSAARLTAAGFLGGTPNEIIFGGSMTSLNFMLSRVVGRTLEAGDEILVTRLDHDANVAPWLELACERNLVVRTVDINDDTTLNYDDLRRQLTSRTRIVAFPLASNAIGTTVNGSEVSRIAHDAGALSWADAVQFAPHAPIDVRSLGVDVLLCSAYKFCGPHLGIAYVRASLLDSWTPINARPAAAYEHGRRFERGTLPFESLAGLIAAVEYLRSLGGLEAIAAWEEQLGRRLLLALPEAARVVGMPTTSGRVPTFLVTFPGISAHRMSEQLGGRGFGVWSGEAFYALGLHDRLRWGEALRIGLIHYNTEDEVDRLATCLEELVRQ
ncbi:MAG TPA: aminotransferase class V-fold PLP-dependent enzyme [Verrucomicrobiae bacterium]|nr:aminotransferase class V-fold PLP-dependent enzyme [Verrucomicrobiae bacterium]